MNIDKFVPTVRDRRCSGKKGNWSLAECAECAENASGRVVRCRCGLAGKCPNGIVCRMKLSSAFATGKKVVSVSRRTDIPAFYGEWFRRRLDAGTAAWKNPFNGHVSEVSLSPDVTGAFVFWSKNFRPFIETLADVKKRGYAVRLHYTITGLPKILEPGVPGADESLDTFNRLGEMFAPDEMIWRYDPIVISSGTDAEYHIAKFEMLAARLSGKTQSCYFSFITRYRKVERRLKELCDGSGVEVEDAPLSQRKELAARLAGIAEKYGIRLFSCCGDAMVSDLIGRGRCVCGDEIGVASGRDGLDSASRPTRDECGCTESVDIGRYDTCPHGCVYCYANSRPDIAREYFKTHDPAEACL
jgi:Fe-S cluster biogenesis protein NfuA